MNLPVTLPVTLRQRRATVSSMKSSKYDGAVETLVKENCSVCYTKKPVLLPEIDLRNVQNEVQISNERSDVMTECEMLHCQIPCESPLIEPIPIPEEPNQSPVEDDWRLWIGNLDSRVTEYSFLKIIQRFGTLEKFDFLYHKVGPDAGKPRGYCFVSYREKQAAEKAMKALNGKLALSKRLAVRWAHKLEDEDVRVKDVKKDTERTNEELSTQAKIRAIEAKLRHMERTKEEITLSNKPSAEPGTSIYSSSQKMAELGTSKQSLVDRRQGNHSKPASKPYSRNEKRK